MRPSDIALSLSAQSKALLSRLHASMQVTVPRLNDGALDLLQHKLAGVEPDKHGHKLYITDAGRSVALIVARDAVKGWGS